eukprot:m.9906 g.9906  ORF g.9906 m.9906 type:complete len:294 (+) comp21732_c0_seq1:112-993(+)
MRMRRTKARYTRSVSVSATAKRTMSSSNYNRLAWSSLWLSRAKLKQSSQTSTLLSGFAMVAMVEAELPANIPIHLLITFGVTTTVLIGVHLFALMVSTCILPYVDAVGSRQALDPGAVRESPHVRLQKYVELAWAFSTIIGIVLFMLELGVICWIKFADVEKVVIITATNSSDYEVSSTGGRWIAALVSSVILGVIVVIFLVFAARFYYAIVLHKYEVSSRAISELQSLERNLDRHQAEEQLQGLAEENHVDVVELQHDKFIGIDKRSLETEDHCYNENDSERSSYHEAVDNL